MEYPKIQIFQKEIQNDSQKQSRIFTENTLYNTKHIYVS